jgi:hypothetical protein
MGARSAWVVPLSAPHTLPRLGTASITALGAAIKGLVWIVVIVGLASLLDSYFYGGFYAQALIRMVSDIGVHMR